MTLQPAPLASALPKQVRLLQQPDGYLSRDYAVTVGKVYDVVGQMGCCLVTTSDIPGDTVSLHRGRFAAVN